MPAPLLKIETTPTVPAEVDVVEAAEPFLGGQIHREFFAFGIHRSGFAIIGQSLIGLAAYFAEYAERENINLSESYAYSDSISDLPMLSIVGHPVAVSPDFRLKQTALQHDWAILDLK